MWKLKKKKKDFLCLKKKRNEIGWVVNQAWEKELEQPVMLFLHEKKNWMQQWEAAWENSLRTKACRIWRRVRNLPCSRKDTSQAVPLKEAELDTLVPLGNVQGFVTLLCEMVAVHVHIGIYMILQ